MKNLRYTVFLFLLVLNNSFPQVIIKNYNQANSKIDCEINFSSLSYQKTLSGNETLISFNGYRDESAPGKLALPTRDIIIALPSYSKVSVVLNPILVNKIKGKPVTNPSVTINKEGELIYGNQKESNVPNHQNQIRIKGYLWIRNYYCVNLEINQYQSNNNIIEELQKGRLSFSLLSPGNIKSVNISEGKEEKEFLASSIVNYAYARQLDKKYFEPSVKVDFWIDFSKTYLKIGTYRDGIYRITKADLEKNGIATSFIPLNSYRLFTKGLEIPVITKGSNNILDDSGYVEFFGRRNMGANYRLVNGPNQPYNEYLDRYSDTTIYWLNWGGDPAKITPVLPTYSSTPVDTVKYYAEIVHYEQNLYWDYSIENLVVRQFPQYKRNQTWVWGQQYPGTMPLPFTISDIYQGKNAKAFYKIQDYACYDIPNAHQVGLSINNDPTVYDSAFFNKNEQKVVSAQFNSNVLFEGNNNLNAISFPTQTSLNSILYDWYEVEYPRYLKANNDSLKFAINDQVGKYLRSFKITNLSSRNIVLYKYDPQIIKISGLTGTGSEIDFSDSVSPGDKYFLINESKISSPVYYYKKNFADIAATNIQADYILITHPILIPTANQYAAFISQNYSLNTKVINVIDIYDQFNYGYLAPEPIKDFLMAANQNWQAPKPMYLFLVGDANYDYYGNKVKYFGTPPVMNYVPSFGEPVSDTWFTIWDSTGSLVPQLYIGRMPAASIEEFQHFFDKHKKYLSTPFDDWNKYYLLFSGGNVDTQGEIESMKGVNDEISTLLTTVPTGGIAHHLYKTLDPRTNFGPYTEDQINYMIGLGGVFISYIGHSGTQTWDNGINDVSQLKNSRGRIPFITDFGCSTGKFAEPDIRCFAELFTCGLDGEAIGYIGNSTLGFTATTYVYPQMFYTRILKQNITTLGKAHVLAKLDLMSQYGAGGTNAVFIYGNTLFTDPVIKLQIPPQPNLSVLQKDITIDHSFLDDAIDSATIKIVYYNYGMVDQSQTFKIQITQSINGVDKFHYQIIRSLPLFMDSVLIKIPIKGNVGTHTITVILDSDSQIKELSKSDNTASFTFNVASNSVRTLLNEPLNNIGNGTIYFINPINKTVSDSILYQVSASPDFSNPGNYYKALDTAYTKIIIPALHQGTRYWFRSKINYPTEVFGVTLSFIYDSASAFSYYLGDSLSIANSVNSAVDITPTGYSLGQLKKELIVYSAALYDGASAVISVNKNNYVEEGQLDGVDVVVFADSTLSFEGTRKFNYWDYSNNYNQFSTDFYHFLDSLSQNKIVCFAFSGSEGEGFSDSLKTMIHSYGSKYIDSVTVSPIIKPFSWAMVGKKGALQGSVPELWSKPFSGAVSIDSVFKFDSQSGSLTTNQIGPVKKWNDLKINFTALNGSSVSVIPVGVKPDGTKDTLAGLNIANGQADLSSISTSVYNYIYLITNLIKGNNSIPSVSNLKIEYQDLPEIGTNFQAVKLSKDTVTIGENITLSFKVLNEGLTEADSIKVRIERVKPDNSREIVAENIIDKLLQGTSKSYNTIYNTSGGAGTGTFVINIDPDNKIKEYYKDNNLFSIPFYVRGDTSRPNITITIDGVDILDGDFVSSNPEIVMQLNDQTLLPITDPSSVTVTLNDSVITSGLKYQFNNTNPKVVVEYNPKLPDGDYIMVVKGKNALGTVTDSIGLTRHFRVNSQAQLMDVYNYPNPFARETYFTFKLTQLPDELKIRIFTVTGRLIKEIVKKSYELNYDFNRVHWDGRDQDGDYPANGVYFYKMVMKKGNITQNVIQKLAIIK
jgi:hypothetical protein